MEEEKVVPVTDVEIKPDEESLKEETVVLKKDPEITDPGNEQEKVLIIESVDDQVKMDENSTEVADTLLRLKTEEFEEKAEQVLGDLTNGVSHYFNGFGGKTEADVVNGDSAVESQDSSVLNEETLVKFEDAEVPVEEKTEEIEAPIVETVKETEQIEIPIEEKTEEAEVKAEEIAEKIIQISKEKNGSVEESTSGELDDKAESTEAEIQSKENIAEKQVDNDAIIEGSSLTSRAVELPFKEEIDEPLKEKVEESKNVIERSTEVEISDPPIVSVTTRTIQPTSWRNCCGLFEVLRRSDR